MEREIFAFIEPIEKNTPKLADKAKKEIAARLAELAPIFSKQKFMLGDEFSMLDVAVAPLLWRLDHYGIDLGKAAAPLMKYAERIFSRQGFIDALTPSEKAMRK
jgi:RNA polymerase-associated protein